MCAHKSRADAYAGLNVMRSQLSAEQIDRGAGAALGCGSLLASLCVAAALLALPSAVNAQSRQIFGGGSSRSDSNQSARSYQGPAEIAEMIDAARADLARGRVFEARRVLEAVIERYPDSRVADEARRLLAPIYSADGRMQGENHMQLGNPDRVPVPLSDSRGPRHDAGALRETAAPAEPKNAARLEAGTRHALNSRQLKYIIHDYRNHVADRVFFGDASVEIGSRSRPVLAAQATWFKRHPSMLVMIEAHADDQGTREVNNDLARRRGEAVRARLIEEGIEAERILISVRGRESPVAPCPDPACAAQNRRVVTIVGDPALERSLPPISGNRHGR